MKKIIITLFLFTLSIFSNTLMGQGIDYMIPAPSSAMYWHIPPSSDATWWTWEDPTFSPPYDRATDEWSTTLNNQEFSAGVLWPNKGHRTNLYRTLPQIYTGNGIAVTQYFSFWYYVPRISTDVLTVDFAPRSNAPDIYYLTFHLNVAGWHHVELLVDPTNTSYFVMFQVQNNSGDAVVYIDCVQWFGINPDGKVRRK